MRVLKYFLILAIMMSLSACSSLNNSGASDPDDDPTQSEQQVSFSTIIALGDSLTAGAMTSSSVRPEVSYATLFASKAGKTVGSEISDTFIYPKMTSGGSLENAA